MSKNLLGGALLAWATGATLLTLIISRRSALSPLCEDDAKQMPPTDVRDQELSLGGVSRGVSILSSEDAMKVDSNEVVSTRKALPKTSRMDQFETTQNASVVPKHLQNYVSKIFQPKFDVENEEFTMIMLTYKRVKMLSQLITHYCGIKRLHKLLVIWNDVDSAIPQSILDLTHTCHTRLEFVKEKENKLTNRFKPRSEIETECKLRVFAIYYNTVELLIGK